MQVIERVPDMIDLFTFHQRIANYDGPTVYINALLADAQASFESALGGIPVLNINNPPAPAAPNPHFSHQMFAYTEILRTVVENKICTSSLFF